MVEGGLLATEPTWSQWLCRNHHFENFTVGHHDLVNRYAIAVTNDHICLPLVTLLGHFLIHDLSPCFGTRVIRRMPQVDKELITLPEHRSTPPPSRVLVEFVLLDLQFSVQYLYVVVCPLSLSLVIMFSVLRITDSDFPSGIFKLFISDNRVYVLFIVELFQTLSLS